MYLLKQISESKIKTTIVTFTFHYVSIKTENPGNIISIDVSFTFHYVSIKTTSVCKKYVLSKLFTFHYVSIKTLSTQKNTYLHNHLHSTMYLLKLADKLYDYYDRLIYIPLCIY